MGAKVSRGGSGSRARLGTVIVAGVAAFALLGFGVAQVAAHMFSSHSSHSKSAQRRIAQFPSYDPARYTTRVDNPWFPLRPGTTYVYRGQETGESTTDRFTVTPRTKRIDGVRCRLIKDRLYQHGRLVETTRDYYTQDEDGNVWYFGEDTAELNKKGHVVSREGSWRTGRKGARAGIFMKAYPQVGHAFPQEHYKGHAEDNYQVLTLKAHVQVPYGSFGKNKLRRSVEVTKEWSPLEPTVREHKIYVWGIGQVKSKIVKGPREYSALVKVIRHKH